MQGWAAKGGRPPTVWLTVGKDTDTQWAAANLEAAHREAPFGPLPNRDAQAMDALLHTFCISNIRAQCFKKGFDRPSFCKGETILLTVRTYCCRTLPRQRRFELLRKSNKSTQP